VLHAVLGVTLAYIGRRVEAIREAERAVAIMPVSKDLVTTGGYVLFQLVRVHLLVGEPDSALARVQPLIRMHYPFLSPDWLRIDPTFAPLRGNPRFDRLVAGE
jgi:serine/threonine-protein kinase